MIIQLALNAHSALIIAAFIALISAVMPGPRSLADAVRILVFRPILATIAGIGLFVLLSTAAAVATAPRMGPPQAAPSKQAPAHNNHRGEPIGDWGGHL